MSTHFHLFEGFQWPGEWKHGRILGINGAISSCSVYFVKWMAIFAHECLLGLRYIFLNKSQHKQGPLWKWESLKTRGSLVERAKNPGNGDPRRTSHPVCLSIKPVCDKAQPLRQGHPPMQKHTSLSTTELHLSLPKNPAQKLITNVTSL